MHYFVIFEEEYSQILKHGINLNKNMTIQMGQ